MNVLIAEDDPDMQKILGLYLRREGYQVDTVGDGAAAVDFLAEHPVDLVVLDWMMPVQNGLDTCREIRRLNIPVKILMLTAKGQNEDEVAGLSCGADDYLRLLTKEIIPAAEKEIGGIPCWRGLAGYSLAGLFALYAIYQTDLFSRVGSMSGSLWFPGMKEYIFSHEPQHQLDCIYFSLGDKESKTKNPILRTVQENTKEICAYYQRKGIDTVFRLNPGNHFVQSVERTAAGIDWLLSR